MPPGFSKDITYYDNGKPKTIRYLFDGKFHRLNGPAYIEYDHNGFLLFEKYYQFGKIHREDGPSWTMYLVDSTIRHYHLYGIEIQPENWPLADDDRLIFDLKYG